MGTRSTRLGRDYFSSLDQMETDLLMPNVQANAVQSLALLKQSARWLLKYSENITSQCGEDGIIRECLKLLPETDGWCVEFGAWDGKHLSNTYNLIAAHGYRAVLIEANPKKFQQLNSGFEYRRQILPIQAFVGVTANDGLDFLLSGLPVPFNFDLLSVDIDGNDYHVWNAVKRHRPKLVVIEYNPTITNAVIFIQEQDASVSRGSSAAALVALAKAKEYELIAVTENNLIFVDTQYFQQFQIPDNSLELMRDDTKCPQIFVGYDGSVNLAENGKVGSIRLPWHMIRLNQGSIQVLPRFLRAYPGNYSMWQRFGYALRTLTKFQKPQRLWGAIRNLIRRSMSAEFDAAE
jgi:hypothetical protein